MSCKLCDHALSHLTKLLIQTEIGTQLPAVLDNTVLRRQKPGLSEEEARRQLNVIAHDLCNMRRLLEWRPKINKWSLANSNE